MALSPTTDPAVPAPAAEGAPRRYALWLAALTFLALLLRYAYATRSGLWRDETLFLGIVGLPTVADVLTFLHDHESHPPLYYLLMRGWQAVFGTGEGAALALPVLLGTALVPSMYWVGRQLFSPRIALFAAALAAVSPILSEHAGLARPYSLLPLLCLFSLYTLHRGLTQGGAGVWAVHALLGAALALTHNWSVLILIAQGLIGLGWLVARGDARAHLRGWLAAQLGILLLYLPWATTLLHQALHAGHAPRTTSPRFVWTLISKCFLAIPDSLIAMALTVPCAALVLLAARKAAPEGRLAYWLFGGVPLLADLIAALANNTTELLWPRTIQIVVPCVLMVLAAGWLALLPARAFQRRLLMVALASFYLVMAVSMAAIPKSNAREVAVELQRRIQPDDLVLIAPGWLASGFNWYFKAPNQQIDYPVFARQDITTWDDLDIRVIDPAVYARTTAILRDRLAAKKRVWFVTDQALIWGEKPPKVDVPANWSPRAWNSLGVLRANQLLYMLDESYGRATFKIMTAGTEKCAENFAALLYEPHKP